jgi:hypothetical protein
MVFPFQQFAPKRFAPVITFRKACADLLLHAAVAGSWGKAQTTNPFSSEIRAKVHDRRARHDTPEGVA